jgi:potassium/hydrogen antiporter
METIVIIVLCILLLMAYIFDITSAWTKIPSVILLLLSGWIIQQLTSLVKIKVPELSSLLPILGTIGLILIILESSFDLRLHRSKIKLINKSFWGALLPLIMLAFFLAFIFYYFLGYPFINSLINAIPFCVISSAIAIPSIKHLPEEQKEFIIFESSLSDILGILFFNFISLNTVFNLKTFGFFGIEILIMLIISLIATFGLAFLLNRVKHHVKFFPIILLIVLIYAAFKVFHMPGLVFIMIFGLSLANLEKIKQIPKLNRINTSILEKEIIKFKDLTAEATFMIRASFFLLFGFLIRTEEIIELSTLNYSLIIVGCIILFRIIQLKISKLPLIPLLFVAPRGLISILLFLSIIPEQSIPLVSRPMMIQVVLLSAFVMMIGLILTKKEKKDITEKLNIHD